MLKIKDNVDLKELEKYGFYYNEIFNQWIRGYWEKPDIITNVIPKTREIVTHCDAFTYDRDVKQKPHIIDLIKADLIEKVEENK